MGKNKRTPTGKIDDARKEADAEWEVEAIIACSTGKEGVKYLVRWKGFDEKHDTYEFEKNLQDAQDALKKFQIDRAKDIAAGKAAAKEKHDAAVEKQRQGREVPCHALLYMRLKLPLQDRIKKVNDAIAANKDAQKGPRRRSNESPWWEFWVRKNPAKGHVDYYTAVCIVPKGDGSGPDGTERYVKDTSKPLEKYIRSQYPALWKKTDMKINPDKHGDTTNVEDLAVPAESYRPMAKTNVQECNQELARWFMKHDRPKHMVCDSGCPNPGPKF